MKISVVLPNYNHGAFIGQSIEGILSQTYQDLELIVVDDGSKDDSAEIISRYQKSDPRVIALFLPENRGVNAAQMEGLRAATGSLYFGAGADDYVCDQTFFATAVDLMHEHPKMAGVFGRSRVLEKVDDRFLWAMGTAPKEGYWSGQRFLDAFLEHRAFIPGSSLIGRLDLLKQAGGFHADLGPQSDYFINHALSAAYGVYFLNRDVAAFRVSPTTYSATATDADYFRRHALMEQKLRGFASNRTFTPQLLKKWREGIVNARFNVLRQESLFAVVHSISRELPPWEKRAMRPDFIQLSERYFEELEPMREELDRQKAMAHATFSEVAGPISEPRVGGVGELGRLLNSVRSLLEH